MGAQAVSEGDQMKHLSDRIHAMRAQEHQSPAEATSGARTRRALGASAGAGQQIDACREHPLGEVDKMSHRCFQGLGRFWRCPLVWAVHRAGPLKAEQWPIVQRGNHQLDACESLDHLRQTADAGGRSLRERTPSAGQILGWTGTQGAESTGARVIDSVTTQAQDHALGAFGDGRRDQLTHAPAAGQCGVALVGRQEVQPDGLGRLQVCRSGAMRLAEHHLGWDFAPQRIAHGQGNALARDVRSQHVEEPRPAIGERLQIQHVVRRAVGPTLGHSLRCLSRPEGRSEGLRGDEHTHRVSVAAAYDVAMTTEATRPSIPLLVLGSGQDLHTERGVECPGELPAPSDPDLVARARAAKAALGDQVFILGHHYQRDEVIEFADVTGDSFKLAREAAARPDARWIVFCGVHFMAESADILTSESQSVILPDLAAGCSMADMAAIDQVEECWDELADLELTDQVVPVTYMNSSAAIKAFTGRHGGTICTSSNATTALSWALDKAGAGGKVLFLPDQHLGRNTYARDLGLPLADCVVWDPHKPMGGLTAQEVRAATMILWRGHCSVHGRFSVEAVEAARREIPEVKVIVHPECRHEVVELADEVGSTEKIIKTIAAAPDGTAWAVGTELNLVRRLAAQFPKQRIVFLEKNVCYCSTMNRIDLPHLVWALESLVDGKVVNAIRVDTEVAQSARAALDQMLALPGKTHKD